MSSNVDRRIDAVVERLSEELVHEDGTRAESGHVADVVHAIADELTDAPLQDFVPLLVENEARDVLHDEGLHRELPEDLGGPVHDPDAAAPDAIPSARY
jgi:hypothetical protein